MHDFALGMFFFKFSFSEKKMHQKLFVPKSTTIPSKIEWDLTNGPRSVSCDRAIRYSGRGVRDRNGPVGDVLDSFNFGHL